MPEYQYTARNREGGTEHDVIIAPTREAAGQLLRQQGLLPTALKEKKPSGQYLEVIKTIFAHVSLLEKLTFIKNLSVTIRAGLPVSRALKVVAEQMPNPYFKKVIEDITQQVESGKTLSESMESYPRVFSRIFINMVRVGEQSGELDKNLSYLATQISRDYNLIRRTKGALMYPAVVMIALVIIGYIMFTYVLPKLTETFKEFDAELPVLTKIIIQVVDVFSSYSFLVLIVFGIIAASIYAWSRTVSGQMVLHLLLLKTPVIGSIVQKINLARFTIIFSSLLKSGMQIVEALRITGDTMGNVHFKNALHDASEKVKVGVNLRSSLEEYPKLFTPMVTQMVQVGEESGTMESVLEEVAHFYEAEVDDSVKNLSSIIEPVLVIVIGAIVGVLAVGLILPIYNIGSSI